MGVLSTYFKPNFLGLLKFLNSMNWFIVLLSLINLSECIYEDQIGKFDWRQSYVGRIKFAQFDTVSTAKRIIVATEENVLAALHLKTGQVVWRHVFESGSAGNIQLLHIGEKVTTVTGSNPYVIRGWDSNTGILLWEWSLTVQRDEQAEFSEWWVQNNMLVHVLPVFDSHVEVTMYNMITGQNRGSTSKFPAQWVNDGCVLSPPYYTCVSLTKDSRHLIALDLTSPAAQLFSKPLANFVGENAEGNLRQLDGKSAVPGFLLDEKLVIIKDNEMTPAIVPIVDQASVTITESATGLLVMQMYVDEKKTTSLKAHSLSTSEAMPEISCQGCGGLTVEAELSSVWCARQHVHKDARVCRILVTAADDTVMLLNHNGRTIWNREEALANIVAVEFVDLPVSELDAAIESEFDQKEDSIWSALLRRLQTQLQQLHTLIQQYLQPRDPEDEQTEHTDLVRDYFNLHKIIVLVTDVGKIFGMDNLSGAILWSRYEPNLDVENVAIFTRRSARHPPYDAYLTIVGKHVESGNGLLISLNPITGKLVGEEVFHLDVPLLQCAILPRADKEKLHAIVLLDADENVQVLPLSSAPLVDNLFIYVAYRDTATVIGYALRYDGVHVAAQKTWSVLLGGGVPGHRIVSAVAKSPAERTHSAGRVLADRSVLYKYNNPNLVLFLTQGPDPVHKEMVVATCVDAVSGAVLCAQSARRARALPLAVHTDNCIAYLYYNHKHRRTEITTLELYEGTERWEPSGAEFSSLAGWRAPALDRQTYILPALPTAAAFTITEKSITDKHVLLALSSGAIIEIPWSFLEPRRPVGPTAEPREEGLVPYTPEEVGQFEEPLELHTQPNEVPVVKPSRKVPHTLKEWLAEKLKKLKEHLIIKKVEHPKNFLPLAAPAVISYNRTLLRITAIHTAPSGLESTSLVLATGLDVFYTRVAPSKTFDLLKDDFDYYLITIVLAGLIVATYSTKYFAARKMLRMAWKCTNITHQDEMKYLENSI